MASDLELLQLEKEDVRLECEHFLNKELPVHWHKVHLFVILFIFHLLRLISLLLLLLLLLLLFYFFFCLWFSWLNVF